MDVLTNCTIQNGITVEKYAHATKDNNTDGVYDKTKCVDACMFKVHKIVSPTILKGIYYLNGEFCPSRLSIFNF